MSIAAPQMKSAGSGDNAAETQQARVDLAAIFRTTARLTMHEGVCNHISVMLPGRRFLMNPKGLGFERITASSLLVIDEHGVTVEGVGRAPISGFNIHTRVHLLHPNAKVVMHLHAPYSTAITAIKGGRLLMVHQNSTRFYGEIAYDDYFNGIADATGEGERMAKSMGNKRVLFLGYDRLAGAEQTQNGIVETFGTVDVVRPEHHMIEHGSPVAVAGNAKHKPVSWQGAKITPARTPASVRRAACPPNPCGTRLR
jgi:ribulose-5-phosphate 4-epimerase/fuculose-1-phosphate aldolase